ncbi:MAG: J domain-containing protein [Pseudomonadota bacterium]
MATIRTHYDNLKVARDAPLEVIRAAYKSLAQRYHPDRNPDDKESERIMQLINSSYDILSNPERRKDHDAWIQEQEEAEKRKLSPQKSSYDYSAESMSPFAKQNTPYARNYSAPPNVPPVVRTFALHFLRFRPVYSLLVGGYIIWTMYSGFLEAKSQFKTEPVFHPVKYTNSQEQSNSISSSPITEEHSPPRSSMIENVMSRFDILAKVQMLQVEVARARQAGMNDDLIYLQLVQSSKLKNTLTDLETKGMSENILINRLHLDISAPPSTLRSDAKTLIANNFFDASASQNSMQPDPYTAMLSAFNPTQINNRISPALRASTPSHTPQQLISLLSSDEFTPAKAQGKISFLRDKGLSDRQIYALLVKNSPFSSRIEKAKGDGFNDNDIANVFGLSLQS